MSMPSSLPLGEATCNEITEGIGASFETLLTFRDVIIVTLDVHMTLVSFGQTSLKYKTKLLSLPAKFIAKE